MGVICGEYQPIGADVIDYVLDTILVGLPSFTQPCSTAISVQSGQTSTSSEPPWGEKRVTRSPIRSERSQIPQTRLTLALVTRIRSSIAPRLRTPCVLACRYV